MVHAFSSREFTGRSLWVWGQPGLRNDFRNCHNHIIERPCLSMLTCLRPLCLFPSRIAFLYTALETVMNILVFSPWKWTVKFWRKCSQAFGVPTWGVVIPTLHLCDFMYCMHRGYYLPGKDSLEGNILYNFASMIFILHYCFSCTSMCKRRFVHCFKYIC